MPTGTASDAPTTERPGPRWVGLLVFLAVTLAAGFVGNLLQGEDVGPRYLALDLPAWAPPQDAFGIVWPILYVLIGIAAWRVWVAAGALGAAQLAFGLWAAQLVVNASWSGVFFGLSAFGPAIAVIVVLDVLVAALIVVFRRHDRWAALLLAPYLVWILYATALNVAIWSLN